MSKLSKKQPSLRRKLSFEIPRLKLGSSKIEEKAPKQAPPPPELDSPPPTPRSVRPPLSPKVDHQLRLACTYVLQDFKPSHQLYEEQFGKKPEEKRQSDQPSVKPVSGLTIEPAAPLILNPPSERTQPKQWSIDSKDINPRGLDVPPMKPTIKSQAFFEGLHLDTNMLDAASKQEKVPKSPSIDEPVFEDLSNFNPPIMSQAFFEGVDLERLRKATAAAIEEHPVPVISPQYTSTEAEAPPPLKRSFSSPGHSRAISVEPAKPLPRSDSVQTTSSTPRTERTEASKEHSRNASTAPTSAAITPATHSMRGSSQAMCSSTEKFLTKDIDWMRVELEKYKRAQEELRAQQELENQVLLSLGLETLPTAHSKQSSVSSGHVQQRRHVPRPSAENHQPVGFERSRSNRRQASIQERRNAPPVPQLDSRQSREPSRSESRLQRSTPRSESAHELEMLRPDSRQSQRSSGVQPEVKRSSAPISPASEMSRASSRSRRLFQVNRPTNDGTKTPPASMEGSKLQSRSRSIESIRSAVSAIGQSNDSAMSKLRGWKNYRTNEDSSSNDVSTQLSKRHSRDFSFEFQQASDPHRKSKTSVNLNRELPPLPSLDQWKPEEPTKSKHIASLISPKSPNFRLSEAASASEPNLLENQLGLSPHIGSTSGNNSRINSIYSRYAKFPETYSSGDAPPYTPLPTDADFPHSGTHERFDVSETDVDLPQSPPPPPVIGSLPSLVPPALLTDDSRPQRVPSEYMFRSNFGKVTVPLAPPPIPADVQPDVKTIRRKTEDMFLPDLDARARTATKGDTTSPPPAQNETPPQQKEDSSKPVNYSRPPPRKQPSVLRKQQPSFRMVNQISAPLDITHLDSGAAGASATAGKSPSHAKAASEQINFSRVKPSPPLGAGNGGAADGYSKLYDMGYRNIVHITPVREGAPSSSAAAVAARPGVVGGGLQRSATAHVLPTSSSSGADRAMGANGFPVRKESKRWWKRAASVKRERAWTTDEGVKVNAGGSGGVSLGLASVAPAGVWEEGAVVTPF